MRITCPSCASHFELPSELLGKKGRALKCATCQHAWYQAAQVESLDLAAIMGEDYAQKAAAQTAQSGAAAQQVAQQARAQQRRAAAGAAQRVPPQNVQPGAMGMADNQRNVQAAAVGAPRDPGRNAQAPQMRQPPLPPLGAPPVPPGAVSMMSRRNQPGQQRPLQPQAPGAPQQAPPSTAHSWFAGTARGQHAQQPQPHPGAVGGPGAMPQQAAAVLGPVARGQQAAPDAPGQGTVSWINNPGAQVQPQVAPLGVPGAQAGPGAAPLPGQSLRGQAAAAPGQGSVSWMNNPPQAQSMSGAQGPMGAAGGPGGPLPGVPPGYAQPGAVGGPGGPPHAQAGVLGAPISPAQAQAAAMAGQSMRGQAGASAAPGQGAVSWIQQPGVQVGAQGAPGAPGQSVRPPGAAAGPGEAAVSWIKPGTEGAPGGPGQSMMNQGQPAGPGGVAVSQLTNEIVAPGQGSRSLLDGSLHGPGAPGQSMLDNAGAAGGPGAPGATGAPGGAAGGSGGGPGAKKGEAELVPGAAGGPKAAGELKSAAAAAAALGTDDDDLVDPDADRPNFGSAEGDEAADAQEQDEDDGFAQVAARSGGGAVKPFKRSKPMNPAYVTAMMMGAIVLLIVGVLWLGREQIALMMPQFRSLYSSVGVEAPRPGDGLSISESSKRLQRIAGVETLVVQGFVSNIGELPRTVPGIRLELYNEKKEVIQAQVAPAPAGLLDPAASAAFEIRLELPQLNLAKGGYAVVWDVE